METLEAEIWKHWSSGKRACALSGTKPGRVRGSGTYQILKARKDEVRLFGGGFSFEGTSTETDSRLQHYGRAECGFSLVETRLDGLGETRLDGLGETTVDGVCEARVDGGCEARVDGVCEARVDGLGETRVDAFGQASGVRRVRVGGTVGGAGRSVSDQAGP
jgi:hypothetical protein